MDIASTLAIFDSHMRRDLRAVAPSRVERVGPVVRYLGDTPDSWEAVLWADLDGSTADAEIARQVAFFAARGARFEWKYYAYDSPADLPVRLVAAGFKPADEEAVMVGETSSVHAGMAPPEGVRLVPVDDAAGVDAVVRVHDEVFGNDHSGLRDELLSRLASDSDAVRQSTLAVVAMAGDRAVCAARVEFHEGTDFASLWGGGTLPQWRGRGIYRALLGYRARLAAERGYRFLQVDATADSRRILEQLGLSRLTTTTPYVWRRPS